LAAVAAGSPRPDEKMEIVCARPLCTHERRGRSDQDRPIDEHLARRRVQSPERGAWSRVGAIAHTDKSDTSSVEDLSNCIPGSPEIT
jgi:hypothetical protein